MDFLELALPILAQPDGTKFFKQQIQGSCELTNAFNPFERIPGGNVFSKLLDPCTTESKGFRLQREIILLVVTNQGVWVGQELLAKVLGGTFKALQQRVDHDRYQHSDYLGLLTERERGVALAVARGATNKEAARQLDITERTVKAHLSAIFKKLEVRDRLQLILKLAPVAEQADM